MGAEVWILLAASALALQLVTLLMRREHKAQLPYVGLLVADLAILVFATATHRETSLVAKVAASLAGVMVLGPYLLERLERQAFGRDDLEGALRAAKLRELLVPGLGATRRRRQIANLIDARAGGATQVLQRLDAELAGARAQDELTTLLIERATILFMAGRYRECIDSAARLPGSWAADHPVLGVYLLRAHAELGELTEALAVLRAVESGPAVRDPGALGLLTQARLTLLAFAGQKAEVDRLLAGEAQQLVSPRAREFLHDTARDHAGVVLPEALARAMADVATRAAESARPLVRARRAAPVTVALVAINILVAGAATHFATLHAPAAGVLIRWGALFRPAVEAGEWWRGFTALFLHGGMDHLLLNMYALFMLGRFCEELYGSLRFFVVYVAGGLAGALASTLNTHQGGLSVGASGAIMGLLGAIIVVLILRRGVWPEAWRRALLWNLVLLGAIQIYIGFQLPMIDNAAHVGGMLGGGAMALLVAPGGLLGARLPARLATLALALACVGGFVWAGVMTFKTPLEVTWNRLPTKSVTVGGRAHRVPTYWIEDPEHDRVEDPYLGVGLGQPTKDTVSLGSDPELDPLIDRIAKTSPSP